MLISKHYASHTINPVWVDRCHRLPAQRADHGVVPTHTHQGYPQGEAHMKDPLYYVAPEYIFYKRYEPEVNTLIELEGNVAS